MNLTGKRIGSLFLTFCMVFTMLPTMAFAETGNVDSGTPLGASGTITAFAPLEEDDTATGSNAAKETQTTVEVSDWISDPAYDGDAEGVYTFTPALELPDGVTVAYGVAPPTITVTVKEQPVAPQARGAGPLSNIIEINNQSDWDTLCGNTSAIPATGGVIQLNTNVTGGLSISSSLTSLTIDGTGHSIDRSIVFSNAIDLTLKNLTVHPTIGNGINALYLWGGGTLTTQGTVALTGDNDLTDTGGDGVFSKNTLTITASDTTTFTGGSGAMGGGSGVWMQNGSLTLNGGSPQLTGGSGYGVKTQNGGGLTITSGSPSFTGGVTSSGNGLAGVTISGDLTVTSSGSPVFTGGDGIGQNSGQAYGAAVNGNLYISAGTPVFQGGAASGSEWDSFAGRGVSVFGAITISGDASPAFTGGNGAVKGTGGEGAYSSGGITVSTSGTATFTVGANGDYGLSINNGSGSLNLASLTGVFTATGDIMAFASATPSYPAGLDESRQYDGKAAGYTLDMTGGGTVVNAEKPNITAQPVGATYTQGATATPLSVTASVTDGGTLSYQWYNNGHENHLPQGLMINDATGSSYTPSTSIDGITYYYCTVTNTNNSASEYKTANITSDMAKVTVNAGGPVVLRFPDIPTWESLSGGKLKVSWNLVDNASGYQLKIYKDGAVIDTKSFDSATFAYTMDPAPTDAGSYTFTVAAVGDGTNYITSPHSMASTAYVVAPAGGTVTGNMYIGGKSGVSLASNQSGTGWAWGTATATLMLDSSYNGSNIQINCAPTDTINLVYIGDVSITGSSALISALVCHGNLNINGSGGTMTVNYTSSSSDYVALEVMGKLTIQSGTLNAISAGSGLLPQAAAVIYADEVTITGSANVTATATGAVSDGISTNPSGDGITISTSGTVTAGGKGTRYALNTFSSLNHINISNGTVTLSNSDTPANLYFGTLNHTGGTLNGNPPPVATYTISGAIQDGDTGIGLAGAMVWLFMDGTGAPVAGAVTDASGAYTFQDIPAGIYYIEAQCGGYQNSTISGVVVTNSNVSGKDLTLTKSVAVPVSTITITGIVEPVRGASPVKTGATVPADANYAPRENIVWVDDENKTEPMADGAKFEAGKRYLCGVSVQLPFGHSFAPDVTATINGKTATVELVGKKEAVVTYLFTAKDAADTPTITVTKHPKDVTVTQGKISGALTAEAVASNGKPVSYQWFRFIGGIGSDNVEIIPGATSNTFTIPTNLTAGTYRYLCTFNTDGNDYVDSNTAVVTVNPPSGSGDNGGSGGNGGGSTPPATAPATPQAKPNQPTAGTAPVTATAGANGAANATVSDKAITDAIAKAQADANAQGNASNGISVELNVTMPQGATSLSATLSQNALQSLVSAGVTSLTINGSLVKVTFDLKALQEIQKQSNGSINISIAPQANLSAAARAMIGTRPVYDLTVSYGSGKTVSGFGGGTAAVSVPYTHAKGEAVGALYAVYVDEKGNATRIAGSAYDANSRSIIFTTTHFSLYGVGYTAPSAKFTDVANHWAKESIDYVVGRGLFGGVTANKFNPDTAITRGEFVTALGRLAGVDAKAFTKSNFTDVKADSPFRPYIEWAYSKGVVQGIGNQQFAPDRAITRQEIAVILQNYAKATGYKLPVTRTAVTFADAASIGSAYKTAVTSMQQAGIMMGEQNNKFNPAGNTTRAEASAMLHRYIKLTIDPATAQGWALNDDGQYLYYKDGKALTGTQTIDGVKYFFNTDGTLKTGWVKDGDNWRYYSGNKMLIGWWNIGSDSAKKTYYFDTYGNMVSGKWLQIDGKWYYFYFDGSLAKSTKVDGYEVDENGVRKSK